VDDEKEITKKEIRAKEPIIEDIVRMVNTHISKHGCRPIGIILGPNEYLRACCEVSAWNKIDFGYLAEYNGLPVRVVSRSTIAVEIDPRQATYFAVGGLS
jgi:hypothetical protein